MGEATVDDFTKIARFFFKTVGIEPYMNIARPQPISLFSKIVWWVSVINLSIDVFCEIIYCFIAFFTGTHVFEGIMNVTYIGFIGIGMSKMLFLSWKKPSLNNLMHELELMFPRTEEQRRISKLSNYLRTSTRISFTFAALYCLLIWTYNLFSVGEYLIYERWLHSRVVGLTLPYYLYIPWNWEDHWSYYALLVSVTFGGYCAAAWQISTDLLLCAAATQLIMHYDYLGNILLNHKMIGDWKQDSEYLGNIVRYHGRVLQLSNNINDIFGVPLLLNFMVSSVVICFVGFQMTVNLGGPPGNMVKLILYLFTSLCQVYMICHYGQLIENASVGIALAAYNQNWLSADVRYKKALVFIMARAQKPAHLKATVFVSITRGTMTELLQISYKFFAVVRTMYAK